jgi:hypothetical protein
LRGARPLVLVITHIFSLVISVLLLWLQNRWKPEVLRLGFLQAVNFGTHCLGCSRRETQRGQIGEYRKHLHINAIHHQFSSITATKDVGNDKG